MAAAPPRIFIQPSPGAAPLPFPGEAEHLVRVLRARVGDLVIGLDGAGGEHPLRIRACDKRNFELEPCGDPIHEPAPGRAGAPLPWIEVAVAWPRPNRADDMLDRLTQLGVAAIRPLDCAHAGPQGLPDDEHKRERCLRVLREACKQARRHWLPQLHAPCTVEALLAGPPRAGLACMDPRAAVGLPEWIARQPQLASATGERPLVLCIGPEGGFDERERAAFATHEPSAPVVLAPHVLRIETAAEAAAAVAVALLCRSR